MNIFLSREMKHRLKRPVREEMFASFALNPRRTAQIGFILCSGSVPF